MDTEKVACSNFRISLVGDSNICKQCGFLKSEHSAAKAGAKPVVTSKFLNIYSHRGRDIYIYYVI